MRGKYPPHINVIVIIHFHFYTLSYYKAEEGYDSNLVFVGEYGDSVTTLTLSDDENIEEGYYPALELVDDSDNGKVLTVANGEWQPIQEHYVSGDKFRNTDSATWFTGTFSSTTSFRFTMSLPKRRYSGTASVTKATASIYIYDGTNKASNVDFKNTANYSVTITLLSDSLASIQLISPTAFSSVTAGSTGSVYFEQGNFEISFT